ncbi:YchJ family protein [Streptomyces sp. NPDC051569]|uniref:YchJ family protein n=1 Tax=Streptomyces sp. NPDC051569 TaxID=3365661 RepID=UPI0037950F65
MSRRPARSSRPAPSAVTAASPCPCGLPATYGACCGRFHGGAGTAPTAELLMRSRYSAFVVRDEPYLLRSWAPATRPPSVEFDPAMRWAGLEILETTDGSAFHTTGTVTFRARFTDQGRPGSLHERSRFSRHEGAWVYVDGTFLEE